MASAFRRRLRPAVPSPIQEPVNSLAISPSSITAHHFIDDLNVERSSVGDQSHEYVEQESNNIRLHQGVDSASEDTAKDSPNELIPSAREEEHESASLLRVPVGLLHSSASLPGTKPWMGGVVLTSTGWADLDALLLTGVVATAAAGGGNSNSGSGSSSGGQPLGTCIYVGLDRWTNNLGKTVVQYWCAEAISQGQHLLIPILEHDIDSWDSDGASISPWDTVAEGLEAIHDLGLSARTLVEDLLYSLPRNRHMDKARHEMRTKLHECDDQNARSNLSTLDEIDDVAGYPDEDAYDGKAEAGLNIAWQYRRLVQEERFGLPRATGSSPRPYASASRASQRDVFCHSFDLGGRLSEQVDVLGASTIPSFKLERDFQSAPAHVKYYAYFQFLLDQVQRLILQETGSSKVLRVLLYHPPVPMISTALILLLAHIRTHQWPVVVMVAVAPWRVGENAQSSSGFSTLQRVCDVVLETEGFASRREYPPPREFQSLLGLLHVRKLSTLTVATALGAGHFADMTQTKYPMARLLGFRRDRRKLHLQLLHIPPDDGDPPAPGVDHADHSNIRSNAGGLRSVSRPQFTTSAAGLSSGKGGHGCSGAVGSPLDF